MEEDQGVLRVRVDKMRSSRLLYQRILPPRLGNHLGKSDSYEVAGVTTLTGNRRPLDDDLVDLRCGGRKGAVRMPWKSSGKPRIDNPATWS